MEWEEREKFICQEFETRNLVHLQHCKFTEQKWLDQHDFTCRVFPVSCVAWNNVLLPFAQKVLQIWDLAVEAGSRRCVFQSFPPSISWEQNSAEADVEAVKPSSTGSPKNKHWDFYVPDYWGSNVPVFSNLNTEMLLQPTFKTSWQQKPGLWPVEKSATFNMK